MDNVTSADGTVIAFERFGSGQPVILVGGALDDRAVTRPLAEQLAPHFAVINYDRRGRGDSGDTAPFAVQREIDDLGALVAEAGGEASVYGHSSGAGLVLHAAAHGLPISKLVLHEPPYQPGGSERRQTLQEYDANLANLLSEGSHDEAVELFMTMAGSPPEAIAQMRSEPWWAGTVALAPTLAYESEIMSTRSGGTIPADLVRRVGLPTLVLCGGASPEWMVEVGKQVADTLPDGWHIVLADQGHLVAPEVLAPVLAEFFTD